MNKTEKLRRIIERSLNNPIDKAAFDRQVTGILFHLGASEGQVDHILQNALAPRLIPDLDKFEAEVQDELDGWGLYQQLPLRMIQRAGDWFETIKREIKPGMKVLDLGGGSGELAVLLADYGCDVTIVDIQDRRVGRALELPFHLEVDNQVPSLAGQTFDTVLLLTVLHHADDVEEIIELADSFAPDGKILIVESVAERGWFGYVALIDWFYNHVLHYNDHEDDKVNVPCHFRSAADWENLILAVTGRVAKSEALMIYMKLNPEPHHLLLA